MMTTAPAMVWSQQHKKWHCYDNQVIAEVLRSEQFVVPAYDYAPLEAKFSQSFSHTKALIAHLPLALEGRAHDLARRRMQRDLQLRHKAAVAVFEQVLEQHITALPDAAEGIDFKPILLQPILESNWVFAGLNMQHFPGYQDLTQVLDDAQPLKARFARERRLQAFAEKIGGDDAAYQLALLSVGVNALSSTLMHSFIKVLVNESFDQLQQKKYFTNIGLKQIERVCARDATIAGRDIRKGDRMRLYLEAFDTAEATDAEKNKRFFLAGTPHACLGMRYSLAAWNSLTTMLSKYFLRIAVVGFDFDTSDGIFLSPSFVTVDFKK